jgi:chorismate mutase
MKKNNNIVELKKVRKNIDEIDSKIIKLISDRFKEIHKVTKLKDNHDQIIDHERITHILKSVQAKAKKNKIDYEVVTRIWQIFIHEAIKLEYSKIKKLNNSHQQH